MTVPNVGAGTLGLSDPRGPGFGVGSRFPGANPGNIGPRTSPPVGPSGAEYSSMKSGTLTRVAILSALRITTVASGTFGGSKGGVPGFGLGVSGLGRVRGTRRGRGLDGFVRRGSGRRRGAGFGDGRAAPNAANMLETAGEKYCPTLRISTGGATGIGSGVFGASTTTLPSDG